MFIAYTDVLN